MDEKEKKILIERIEKNAHRLRVRRQCLKFNEKYYEAAKKRLIADGQWEA